jgi:hypothetical protein
MVAELARTAGLMMTSRLPHGIRPGLATLSRFNKLAAGACIPRFVEAHRHHESVVTAGRTWIVQVVR